MCAPDSRHYLLHKKAFLNALIVISLAALITACNPASSNLAAGCNPGTYDEQISSGGQTRQYRLHIPSGYRAGTPAPLVFGFHGAGSTGLEFERYSGFSLLADQAGFIAVYPQGLGDLANWDTLPNSKDVAFVRDLLAGLEARCSIDPRRVFATGHSRGGGMANRLGCELSDRLAAIGPVSGDYENGEFCSPVRPLAVVAFHGTSDPTIPYNGFGLPGAIHESYTRIGTPIPPGPPAGAHATVAAPHLPSSFRKARFQARSGATVGPVRTCSCSRSMPAHTTGPRMSTPPK